MSIESEARIKADDRWGTDPVHSQLRAGFRAGYIAGASREVTDVQADAAHRAFHEYVFGPDEPLSARDLGVGRQAWKVALEAAGEVRA